MVVWAPTGEDPQGDHISPFPAKSRKYGSTRISTSQRMISHALPKTKPVGDDLQLTALFGQPMMMMTLKASLNKCNKVWKMQIHFYKDIFTAFAIIIIKLPNARKWTGGWGGGRHGRSWKLTDAYSALLSLIFKVLTFLLSELRFYTYHVWTKITT